MDQKRTIIIGLDGVPCGLLKDLTDQGIMPNTRDIISQGTLRRMRSSIPEISSVAWSSVITGKNPAEHGIFGFTDFPPNTYRLSFPNASCLKTSTFWEADSQNRHIIVNVPSTYPAKPLNGVLISGFASDADAELLLSFELPANHGQEGLNLLCRNHSVEWHQGDHCILPYHENIFLLDHGLGSYEFSGQFVHPE